MSIEDRDVEAAIAEHATVELERWLEHAATVDPDRQPEEYRRTWEQIERWDAIAEGKTVDEIRDREHAEERASSPPTVDDHDGHVTAVSWSVAARDAAQERGDELAAAVFGGEAREALASAVQAGITPEELATELDYPDGADALLGIDGEFVRSLARREVDGNPAGVERSPEADDVTVATALERAEQAVAQARTRAEETTPRRDGTEAPAPTSDAGGGHRDAAGRIAAEETERYRRDAVEREAGGDASNALDRGPGLGADPPP